MVSHSISGLSAIWFSTVRPWRVSLPGQPFLPDSTYKRQTNTAHGLVGPESSRKVSPVCVSLSFYLFHVFLLKCCVWFCFCFCTYLLCLIFVFIVIVFRAVSLLPSLCILCCGVMDRLSIFLQKTKPFKSPPTVFS